jgi:hypothetical protein
VISTTKKQNPRKTLAPSSSEKIKTIPISVRLEDLTTFNRNSIRPIQTTFGAQHLKNKKFPIKIRGKKKSYPHYVRNQGVAS